MSIVASVAKDGVAPELRQEGALREKRYSCSTARASYAYIFVFEQSVKFRLLIKSASNITAQ